MFCPKCRYEYKPEVTVCPDCEEQLVATLPPEEPEFVDDGPLDWVEIARLNSPVSAEVVLDVLRAKDIPVVVMSGSGHFGQTGQMGPSTLHPIAGPFKVMVREEFIEAADREAGAVLGEEWESARIF